MVADALDDALRLVAVAPLRRGGPVRAQLIQELHRRAMLADAPLGRIRFHEGHTDSPRCPCGNDTGPAGDGFRPVMSDGALADDFTTAWAADGKFVGCCRTGCGRVWSDAQISPDGHHAPVLRRLDDVPAF